LVILSRSGRVVSVRGGNCGGQREFDRGVEKVDGRYPSTRDEDHVRERERDRRSDRELTNGLRRSRGSHQHKADDTDQPAEGLG
jgi:hypothetical protein